MNPGGGLNTWLVMVLIFGAFTVFIGLLRIYQVKAQPDPEMVRKLFHMGGGLVGLPLPWLFSSIVPVLGLATAVAVMFVSFRIVPALQNGPGKVLAGVGRKSVGEFCFLLSLCLLFWQARGSMILYGVPLLILAIADTFAALVGAEYGKQRFRAWKQRKSVEGSAAFFIAAFFCVHVPVLIFTDTPRLESLLIAVNIALMVMMAEAASWWGLDNLIIPVFSFVLLKMFLPMQAFQLAEHLAFLLSLSLLVRILRPRVSLADDALFGAALWGYAVWSVAGWVWLFPQLLLLATYRTVTNRSLHKLRHVFNFPVVLANIAGGILCLSIYRNTEQAIYFYPFAAICAADLAIIALIGHKYVAPQLGMANIVLASTAKGVLLLLPCILIADGITPTAVVDLLASSASVLFATALFAMTQPDLDTYPVGTSRWVRQAVITTGSSAVALLPYVAQF